MSETNPPQQFVERRAERCYLTVQDVKTTITLALMEHEIREKANMDELILTLKEDLVPMGDAYKHKDYHEKKINAAKAEEDFWVSARKKVIENGITGLFGVLKILVFLGFISIAFKFGITLPAWLMK